MDRGDLNDEEYATACKAAFQAKCTLPQEDGETEIDFMVKCSVAEKVKGAVEEKVAEVVDEVANAADESEPEEAADW